MKRGASGNNRAGSVSAAVVGAVLLLITVSGFGALKANVQADVDFDDNGEVGFDDFVLFALAFGSSESRFDLDNSGLVDFIDFVMFTRLFAEVGSISKRMILIPEGGFWMGSDNGEQQVGPRHSVNLDAFYVDEFEVTVQDYEACVEAGPCEEPAVGQRCNWNKDDRGDHPINCVSWDDAFQYCDWRGKRLPTEAEWEKAAGGTDGRVYPWGNTGPNCEVGVLAWGSLGCGRQGTWPVGSKAPGASPYGVMDVAGNVWEWVADWHDRAYYATSPSRNPVNVTPGEYKVLRGDSWYYSLPQVASQVKNRYRFKPRRWYPYIGFRCVRSSHNPLESLDGTSGIDDGTRDLRDWMDKNRAALAAEGDSDFAASPVEREMVKIPEGEFIMGSNQGDSDEFPIHNVYLDAFYVDKYEVTADQYRACVDAGACEEAYQGTEAFQHDIEGTYCNWGRSDRGDHPINCVSWNDANDYCTWAGKRLPTEAEWEKAARGPDGRRYPWGEEDPDCSRIVMDDGGDGCGRESTWPVGLKVSGASPYGIMDMSGNVWEWVEDWYDRRYYSSSPDVNPLNTRVHPDRMKVLRSGSMADQAAKIYTAANRQAYWLDTKVDYTVGFRCAREAEE